MSACRVGRLSCRRSAHLPRTAASPNCSPPLTFAHPLLRHHSPLLSCIAIRAALRASCEFKVYEWRTPAGWRGTGAGVVGCETGCRDDALPSPSTVAYKALYTAIALSVSFSCLSTLSVLICHSSRSTPSARVLGYLQDRPLRYLDTLSSPIPSFFPLSFPSPPLSSLCSRSSPHPLCSTR